jgi:hypothetical protein
MMDLANLEDELRNEVSMRKRVYERDVQIKKKTQAQADLKIAQMQAMVRLVVALQDPRTRLCLGCGTREEFFLGGDELGKWLADPETYVLASRRQRREAFNAPAQPRQARMIVDGEAQQGAAP